MDTSPSLSTASRSAPLVTRLCTTCTHPLLAATCSGLYTQSNSSN